MTQRCEAVSQELPVPISGSRGAESAVASSSLPRPQGSQALLHGVRVGGEARPLGCRHSSPRPPKATWSQEPGSGGNLKPFAWLRQAVVTTKGARTLMCNPQRLRGLWSACDKQRGFSLLLAEACPPCPRQEH